MMRTCEYEIDLDVDPFPERCGKPAAARWIDGATGESHYTCDEHGTVAVGLYERAPLEGVSLPVHAVGCTEYDEDSPSRCALGCPVAMTVRAEAFLADGTGSTPAQRQAAHYILHGTWPAAAN